MTTSRIGQAVLIRGAILLLVVAGCGASGSADGTGGAPAGAGTGGSATGGATSTGGATGSGGKAGGATGGTTAGSGGAVGSGGRPGSGGTVGSGGVTATGGATATGGTGEGHTGGAGAAGGAHQSGGISGAAGAASGGRGGGAESGGAGAGGRAAPGGQSGAVMSAGCGKTPTLKNSATSTANQNTLTVSGSARQFLIRWPSNYDNSHPYRLILDFHGANGKDTDLAPSYFGLFDLSNNTTIFVAPSASGGIWDATADATFVDEILKAVEGDLCIDTSRVELEGFSQGGAMVATLACGRPGVFRAAVGHSRGGLTAPTACQPIPYLGSLGLSDISGNSQATQTDAFARWDGCTITTLPTAPTGGHICTSYTGCMAGAPVVWCSFDGPHTASPTDAGKSTSWMPAEVWPFLSQF